MCNYYYYHLAVLSTVCTSILTLSTSYQYVSFVKNPTDSRVRHSSQVQHSQPLSGSRKERSFHYPLEFADNFDDFWPDTVFLPPQPFVNHIYQPEILLHTDFSNALDTHDPYLITGNKAKTMAEYAYRKGLYYGDYPHVKALLNLQQRRLANGLRENRLGSLRESSPFNRHKYSQASPTQYHHF